MKNKGLTLIELIVALTIFIIVVVAAISIFLSGVAGQRRILALQNVQDNARYALESMAKEIRMSSINNAEGASLSLNITHPVNGTFDYSFDQTTKQLKRKGEPITSSNLEVTGQFIIRKGADLWPRATVVMKVKSKGGKIEEKAEINLETTVSSRKY